MTVIAILLVMLASGADYPVVEASNNTTLQDLRSMPDRQRRETLLQMESNYISGGTGSGPFTGGTSFPDNVSLILAEVYRPLSPADLEVLFRAGLWPAGYSPRDDGFVAVRIGPLDAGLIRGSGFIRRLSPWDWNRASGGQPDPPSGHWLVLMAPGTDPPSGVHLHGDWWRVGSPVLSGA